MPEITAWAANTQVGECVGAAVKCQLENLEVGNLGERDRLSQLGIPPVLEGARGRCGLSGPIGKISRVSPGLAQTSHALLGRDPRVKAEVLSGP